MLITNVTKFNEILKEKKKKLGNYIRKWQLENYDSWFEWTVL
jgi:hypothetical protein